MLHLNKTLCVLQDKKDKTKMYGFDCEARTLVRIGRGLGQNIWAFFIEECGIPAGQYWLWDAVRNEWWELMLGSSYAWFDLKGMSGHVVPKELIAFCAKEDGPQ